MKKVIKCLSVVLCLILLTGCLKLENSMLIRDDKSFKFEMIFGVNVEQLKEMLGVESDSVYTESGYEIKAEDYQEFSNAGFNVSEYTSEDGYEGVRIYKEYDSIDDVLLKKDKTVEIASLLDGEGASEDDLKSLKFFSKNGDVYKGSFLFDLTSDEANDLIPAEEMKDLFLVSFKMELPEGAISNNATTSKNDNKELEWKFECGKKEIANIEFEVDDSNYNYKINYINANDDSIIKVKSVNGGEYNISVPYIDGYILTKVTTDKEGMNEVTKINNVNSDTNLYVFLEKKELTATELDFTKNNNKITLDWKKVYCDKYYIYRSTSGKKGTWKKIKTITDYETTSFTDTGLTYGKKYYYKVATVEGKNVLYSDSSYVSIKPETVEGDFDSSLSTSIKIKWDKVPTTGYEIYRSTTGISGSWKKVKTITKNSTLTYKDSGLKANKTYYYKVRAYKTVNGKKVYGNFSDTIEGLTGPAKPVIKIGRDYSTIVDDKVLINYYIDTTTSKGATNYSLYISTKKDTGFEYFDDIDLETGKYIFDYSKLGNELKYNKTYYFRVKAQNEDSIFDSVYSTFSEPVKLIIRPANASSFKVSTTKGKVKFKITESKTYVDGYEILYKTSKGYKVLKEITDFEELNNIIELKATSGKTNTYTVRSYIINNDTKVYSSNYSGIKIKIK